MPDHYDLHSHSTASDGTLSPVELIRRAKAAGVGALALTDHDTTAGIPSATAEAESVGLSLIPGVEISVTWRAHTVHVVGLRIDRRSAPLRSGLARLRRFRDWRAEEIGRRLGREGIPDAYHGARALSNGRLISRTHFARHLVSLGLCADVRKVFQHFLVRGKPGHVPGEWATLEEAVSWIREAGGDAVIAHPARYPFTRTKRLRLFGEFQECGGSAIEVVSGSHSRDDCFVMARHASELGLLASAGSDYHGPENPWVELGRLLPLPRGCEPIWSGWGRAPGATGGTGGRAARSR